MPNRRIILAAAAAVLAVAAALGVHLVTGPAEARDTPALNESRAVELTGRYRRDAVGRMPSAMAYTEAVRTSVACATPAGQYIVSSRFDFSTTSADAATAFTNLRAYWKQRGYQVVNDTPGTNGQLLVQDPADGFRIGISQRAAGYVRLAISSPCLTPDTPPADPVLSQDLATARNTYEQYVAGQLGQLTTQVAALRAAVAGGDVGRARAAWLTAQLTWERVGAAYGTFGDLADAVDGLPDGSGNYTGLHRVEYGLWHGESTASLLAVVDRLGADVGRLATTLHDVLPEPGDLTLRVHEVLEDALRDHLTGLTDLGSGSGLAETWADVDATRALLEMYAPLIDARRPGLTTTAGTELDALRQKLEGSRDGTAWRSLAALDPAVRGGIEAALGSVLETLADMPGLLEVVGS